MGTDIVERLRKLITAMDAATGDVDVSSVERAALKEIERLRAAIFPLSFLEKITKQEVDDTHEQGIKAGMHHAAGIVRAFKNGGPQVDAMLEEIAKAIDEGRDEA